MIAATLLGVIAALALVLVRLFAGPTLYDRVLAVNVAGTLTVLAISLHGFLTGRPEFLDLAIVYALINFIGTVAVLKFFRYRAVGDISHASLEGKRDVTEIEP